MHITYDIEKNKLFVEEIERDNVSLIVVGYHDSTNVFDLNNEEQEKLKKIMVEVLKTYSRHDVPETDFVELIKTVGDLKNKKIDNRLFKALDKLRSAMTELIREVLNRRPIIGTALERMLTGINNPKTQPYIYPPRTGRQLTPAGYICQFPYNYQSSVPGYSPQPDMQALHAPINNSLKAYLRIDNFKIELTPVTQSTYTISDIVNEDGVNLPIDKVINTLKETLRKLNTKNRSKEEMLEIIENSIKKFKDKQYGNQIFVTRDFLEFHKYYIQANNNRLTIKLTDNSITINSKKYIVNVDFELVTSIEEKIQNLLNID